MLPPSFLPKVDKKRHLLLISEERSITSQGGWVKSLDRQGIVLLQRASRASFLAWVEEDMLQPVKGIELREEDRGEMVPNMGIKSVPVLSPTAHTNTPHVQAAPPLNQRGFISTPDVIGQQSERFWPKKFFHSAREWMLSKRWVSRQRMLRRLTPFRRRYWEEGFKNSLILDVSVLLIHGGGKQ